MFEKSTSTYIELFQTIQRLSNIIYLAKLDADDKSKVQNNMTDAERELEHLENVTMILVRLDQPQCVN